MVLRTDETGYAPVRLVQGETAFEAQMVAEGEGPGLSVSAMIVAGGSVSLFGPYRFQFKAYGREESHRALEVRRFRMRFADGQAYQFGPEYLRGRSLFVPGEYRGELVAERKAWKVFKANPKLDGPVTVEVDAVIQTTKQSRAETLKFVFQPSETVKTEFINVPWEIKRSIWKDEREHPVSAWDVR